MRKTLLATSALALAGAIATGPASAAEMLSVGVGGYMEQWVGITDLDNPAGNGGISQWTDAEIFFRGKLEADNGLTFSVKVELEGNTTGDTIDESQITIGGSFGQIVLGSEDHPAALMHYGNQDVGVGYCGDVGWIGVTGCSREGGIGLGTNGWIVGGDDQKIAYYTPRMNGLQFGAAYIPDANTEDANRLATDNDQDGWSAALNYKGDMGDANVAVSFGHYQRGQVGSQTITDIDLPAADLAAYQADIAAYADALANGVSGTSTLLADLSSFAADANAAIAAATTTTMSSKADEFTFSNFGLRVGFGAVGVNVAYATVDGGAYMVSGGRVVKDTSNDYDLMSAGLKYSDGPMAVSLTHMMSDADDGSESNATMLSLAYKLAPGISSKSSIIDGEQGANSGTAFVTGVTIGF